MALILFTALASLAGASPLLQRSSTGPVISSNFQDPSVLKVDNTYYAFSGPNGNPAINVLTATSPDFGSWTVDFSRDALPQLGAWAASAAHVWSPDVSQLVSLKL